MARTFYRIVKTDPPRRRDFLSNQAKRGEPRPNLPAPLRRLWDGLSVHETEEHARRQALENSRLGGYIAEVRLPDRTPESARWERTIFTNEGHYTLWGDPDELLGCVTRVFPMMETPDERDV